MQSMGHEHADLLILDKEAVMAEGRQDHVQAIGTGGEVNDLLLQTCREEPVGVDAHHGDWCGDR